MLKSVNYSASHTDPSVTSVYNLHDYDDYDDLKQQMSDKWGKRLQLIFDAEEKE